MPDEQHEVGALYRIWYTLDRGAGPYLYVADMVYLGPAFGGTEESFSLRPLFGTQNIRADSIKKWRLLISQEECQRRFGGARGPDIPVKVKKRLTPWRGQV